MGILVWAHTRKQFRVTWSNREAASSKIRWNRAQEPSSAAAAASRADSHMVLTMKLVPPHSSTLHKDIRLWSPLLQTTEHRKFVSRARKKKCAIDILKNNTNVIEIKYIYIDSWPISSLSSQKARGKCNPQQVNVLNVWIVILHLQERWLRKYDCIHQYESSRNGL